MKFGDSISQWRAAVDVGKKPRTQDYHRELEELIHREWPLAVPRPVEEISFEDVVAFAQKLSRFSVSRFNAVVSVLRATIPTAVKLKRRRLVLKDRALLSPEEFSRLLQALDARPRSHGGLVIRFLAHTGLRINEARQLRWADVHEDFILAPGTITKNGRPRSIPFVNGIGATLEQLRAIAGAEELVIPQAEVKRALQSACARAGLPRLSHHDFRHLFATRCIQSSVDIPTVARWLGHLDGGALLGRVYFHLVDEHSRKMARRVRI